VSPGRVSARADLRCPFQGAGEPEPGADDGKDVSGPVTRTGPDTFWIDPILTDWLDAGNFRNIPVSDYAWASSWPVEGQVCPFFRPVLPLH